VNEDGSLHHLTDAGQFTMDHIRLDRGQLRRHRRRQIEIQQACRELRELLESQSDLPAGWVAEARTALEEVEQAHLNPPPPYDFEDVRP
jgi:hypothetical protein